MKLSEKTQEKLSIILVIVILLMVIFGIGYVKYRIWRAEHPQTNTWIFFIPNSN